MCMESLSMTMSAPKHWFLFGLFIFISLKTECVSVGSESAVSRQGSIEFLYVDSNNEMKGFAAFEAGFTLQTPSTTCTFNSLFPVSGTVDMGCGTLYLSRDLIFDSETSLDNMGSIYGNGHSIRLSESVITLTAFSPASVLDSSLTQVDIEGLANDVEAVDWSYDSQYVACTRINNHLYVYSFDGLSLSSVDDISTVDDPYPMRAHPSGYYFAVGTSSADVKVYKLSGGTLSLVETEGIPAGGVIKAVDWSHDGNYLAVGFSSDIRVYSFSAESLSPVDHIYYSISDGVRPSAVSWDQTGEYFAVGTSDSLRIFYFDSATITDKKREIMAGGDDVDAVDWSKTGSWIAIGTAGASNQLRVYEYNSGSDTLTEKASISVGAGVKSVHWNSDATKIAVGKVADGSDTELRVYNFDQGTSTLSLDAESEVSTQINSIRWRNNDLHVAYGDEADNLVAYLYAQDINSPPADSVFIDNTFISLNNDTSWKMSTTIQSECTIDGGDHIVTIEDMGVITVTTEAQLTLKNIELRGFSGDTLRCYSDDASIIFHNCKINLDHDFTFATGSILFEGDIIVTGTNKFIYSSSRTSTIAAGATVVFNSDTTFKYSPSIANRDLLYMTDNTSCLYLDSCTLHSTSTGMRLTRGMLLLDNLVTFSSEGSVLSESICFGNGVGSEDLTVKVFSGANLDVYGELYYDNLGA